MPENITPKKSVDTSWRTFLVSSRLTAYLSRHRLVSGVLLAHAAGSEHKSPTGADSKLFILCGSSSGCDP